MSTVTTSSSVSPMLRPSLRTFSARPPGRSRLSVSPCSSRSTIAWCRMPQPPERARRSPVARALRQLEEELLDRVGDRGRRRAAARRAIALIGRPSATWCSSSSSAAVSPPSSGDRLHERLDDLRVEHRAAGRDLAHGARELVALGDAVLQEVGVARRAVGEQRDRVLGVVVLRQHDHAGARVALAQLLRRVDALLLERSAACGCR